MKWEISKQTGRDIHRGLFVEAICEHGVGHHDGTHGCDGCCANWPKEIAKQVTVEKSRHKPPKSMQKSENLGNEAMELNRKQEELDKLKDAARFSNFCQAMKMALWEKSKNSSNGQVYELPSEKDLDEIALKLWRHFK